MIVTDLWILRIGERLFLFVPPQGLAPLWEVFRRYVPPRLAAITDRTGSIAAIELLGPMADDLIESERLPVPPFEHAGSWTIGGVDCAVGSSATASPFVYLLTCPSERCGALIAALYDRGFARLSPNGLEAAHLIAGWPMLGVEIRDKTLPQEVNFDRLAGVSYTKGCYTGQETVARLHFRGHANRRLAGIMWQEGEPDFGDPRLLLAERLVGHVTRALWVPKRNEWVGLGMIRREVEDGETVTAAGRPAVVTDVPMPVRIG
jgi:folate-binding protein YgfZ